jgi:hypothetical protein
VGMNLSRFGGPLIPMVCKMLLRGPELPSLMMAIPMPGGPISGAICRDVSFPIPMGSVGT